MKKDILLVTVIGAAVGLLIQPVLTNIQALAYIAAYLPMSQFAWRIVIFFGFLILAPVALLIANFVGRYISVIYQFAKFAAVGTLNSFIDLGIFNLETMLYGATPSPGVFFVLKSISFLTATTNSYFWNKFWTFEAKSRPEATEAAKFYIIAIIGYGLNAGVATFVYSLGGADPSSLWTNIVSPFAGIFSAFLWNFLGYKFVVFAKKEGGETGRPVTL